MKCQHCHAALDAAIDTEWMRDVCNNCLEQLRLLALAHRQRLCTLFKRRPNILTARPPASTEQILERLLDANTRPPEIARPKRFAKSHSKPSE